MALTAGSRLGPYELVSLVGSGGMGEVYEARDTRLGRTVAIKILPSPDPDLRERFEREAKAVSALNHPGICTLYDVGRDGDLDYLVMEFCEGETLQARLERGALKVEDAMSIAIEVADAIDTAHRAGIEPPPQVRLDASVYAVSPDGRRFLVNTLVEDPTPAVITLVLNWPGMGRE